MALLTWKWFFAASVMAAGLLHSVGAPAVTILGGIVVAAAVTWRYGGTAAALSRVIAAIGRASAGAPALVAWP